MILLFIVIIAIMASHEFCCSVIYPRLDPRSEIVVDNYDYELKL